MNIPSLPKDVAFILDTLRENGFEAYIVGGCVRDSIMGIPPHDWDITTSAKPEEVKGIFNHTVDTGIQHGTVTVVLNGANYEITTYRIEGKYEDFRRPASVSFTKDLHEDLLRRDFTVNAIAYAPWEGYVDVFGGIADIEGKQIKGVGDAAQRFNEDALRMLRAVRFSVQLDFEIEAKTFLALKENCFLIKNISAERIREELGKTLTGKHMNRIHYLWESGLIQCLFPDIWEEIKNHLPEIERQLSEVSKEIPLAFSILLSYSDEKEARETVHFLKFDTKTKRKILTLLQYKNLMPQTTPQGVRRNCALVGLENYKSLLAVQNAQGVAAAEKAMALVLAVEAENQCISIKQLAVNGKDLAEIGIAPGRAMGEALEYLLEEVIVNPSLNQKETLKDLIKAKYIIKNTPV